MKSTDIRQRFLDFFEKRDHTVIPSASLVPENDPSVLFTTAGMQPLVPYLLGQPHPEGQRLVNVQKCVRTTDIEETGDNTHLTFFEMLGNWSIGDSGASDGIGEDGYFKEEAISWSYEFLTDPDEGLGLDPERLYITCFAGDNNAPRDTESAEIWQSVGVPEQRIYYLNADHNWWSPGDNGPCGPDTEMFYDVTPDGLGDMSREEFLEADQRQDVIEIWNDVFMQYEKQDGKVVGELEQKNVDTGAGLERLAAVLQDAETIFDTDLFKPVMHTIAHLQGVDSETELSEDETISTRVVADHIRTACFMIADGVSPDNTGRGYVLRRLIRRASKHADQLGIDEMKLTNIAPSVIATYNEVYPEIQDATETIQEIIKNEEESFRDTLERGRREFEKLSGPITGEIAFDLYQTHGLPIEITRELAKERELTVDMEGFEREMEKHKEKSRQDSDKRFKGGLADTSDISVQYHTATHLLHQALKEVLGNHVSQAGSNITPDRLRFDFTHEDALTDDEIKAIEQIVNDKIAAGLEVSEKTMPVEEAKESGALYLEQANYPDTVSVYSIGDWSKEICGGPHVTNTDELEGEFRIIKETSSSAGVRRVKAVLE